MLLEIKRSKVKFKNQKFFNQKEVRGEPNNTNFPLRPSGSRSRSGFPVSIEGHEFRLNATRCTVSGSSFLFRGSTFGGMDVG